MENYKKLCRELIEDHIDDVKGWDNTKTRAEILNDLADNTENVFGNLDGSRTCNAYQAEQFINDAGAVFDQDIIELFNEFGDDYHTKTLARGPEVYDVVILELLAPYIITEMLNEKGAK